MNTKAIFTIVAIVAALAATSLIPIHQVAFAKANPNAPGQTGNNPGQSDGSVGPPGQTGLNPGHCAKTPVMGCK